MWKVFQNEAAIFEIDIVIHFEYILKELELFTLCIYYGCFR